MIDAAGPWGTGPYKLVEGFSSREKRSERVVLEANLEYWDRAHRPRLKRLVFDNTLGQQEAVELVKTEEGRVDLVTGLNPLHTLRVAESPFATVVKNRGNIRTVFGHFNGRKTGGPWHDVRLRQAVNMAINRDDLIRYAARGNGVVLPALLPVASFGYHPDLTPYPFAPAHTRELLREAGFADGLSLTLIAPQTLDIQATVISKMLEQAGFMVSLQILDGATFLRKIRLDMLEQPPEQQAWDIALESSGDVVNFPAFMYYWSLALDGTNDWVQEQPELRQLYDEVLHTVARERQQALFREMERHIHEQAYFLFLYNPIGLYAVNKAVEFVPYVTRFGLTEISVTAQHWSLRNP